jgi:hypothetical protein
VHASLFSKRSVIEANAALAKAISKTVRKKHRLKLPQPFDFDAVRPLLGHVVGSVDIVDCVTKSKSAWYGGARQNLRKKMSLQERFGVKEESTKLFREVADEYMRSVKSKNSKGLAIGGPVWHVFDQLLGDPDPRRRRVK